MELSKEDVLKFAQIQVSESVSENIKHCKISKCTRNYPHFSVSTEEELLFVCEAAKNYLKAESINIYIAKNRNHSRKLCEHILESTRTLNMTVLEIFHLYAHQNFSSVCKTAKYQKTRRINAKTLRKVIHIREFVRKHTRKVREQ